MSEKVKPKFSEMTRDELVDAIHRLTRKDRMKGASE